MAQKGGRSKRRRDGRGDDAENQNNNVLAIVPPWRETAFPPKLFRDPGEVGRALPHEQLEFEFVHGYSGHDGRGNVCFNCAGEIVYPAARRVVVFNMESLTQRVFTRHTDRVACLAMRRDGVVAASGESSQHGTVFVWDTQSLEVLARLVCPARCTLESVYLLKSLFGS